MPDEKRTFESNISAVQFLGMQLRATRRDEARFAAQAHSAQDEAQASRSGFSFPREAILRLIDWMKDE